MTTAAFFRREGEAFIPGPACRGPWDPKSLHGRVVAGLLGGNAALRVTLSTPRDALPGGERVPREALIEGTLAAEVQW